MLVIRALIGPARCKQHVILFVSHTDLFSNFVLLTSNLGIERDLEVQAAVSYWGGVGFGEAVRVENWGVE